MTTEQRIHGIEKHLLAVRLESMRCYARTKSVEAGIAHYVPNSERDAWYANVDVLTKRLLHEALVAFENQDPHLAAMMDERTKAELEGLD